MSLHCAMTGFRVTIALIMTKLSFPRLDLKQAPARHWLMIGVLALGVSGLLALVLVGGRSPHMKADPELQAIFQQVLAVHVDLSVLVWFLSMAAMLLSLHTTMLSRGTHFQVADSGARSCFLVGILLMVIAPLDGSGVALRSNYIPVITSPLFFLSLALFAAGVILILCQWVAVRLLLEVETATKAKRRVLSYGKLVGHSANAMAFVIALMLLAYVHSAAMLEVLPDAEEYYDTLFWAGGHVMQFTYTLLLLFSWAWLAKSGGMPLSVKLYAGSLVLLALPLMAVFWFIAAFPPEHALHRYYYTRLMIEGNGVGPALFFIGLVAAAFKYYRRGFLYKDGRGIALICSIILFAGGGVLGLLIEGEDTRVPAHYHGSVVGVSVALMGLAVALLPLFGYRRMWKTRLARWQPVVLTVGQLMHIGGLAYGGGYGLLRKTVGGVENLPMDVKIALGVTVGGGVVAIVGGVLFVILMWRATRRKRHPER